MSVTLQTFLTTEWNWCCLISPRYAYTNFYFYKILMEGRKKGDTERHGSRQVMEGAPPGPVLKTVLGRGCGAGNISNIIRSVPDFC